MTPAAPRLNRVALSVVGATFVVGVIVGLVIPRAAPIEEVGDVSPSVAGRASPQPTAGRTAAPPSSSSLTPRLVGIDNAYRAIPIRGLPFEDFEATKLGGFHVMEPAPHCGTRMGSRYWYNYVSATPGRITVDTFGSGYDTVIEVFTGSLTGDPLSAGWETLHAFACNDDVNAAGESQVTFDALAGTSYMRRPPRKVEPTDAVVLVFHAAPAQ